MVDHAQYFTYDSKRDTMAANRYALLAMRCRLPVRTSGEHTHIQWAPLEGVHIWFSGDKAFIFYVAHGQWAVLEDDAGAFPSDVLVASLKLVLNTPL